jgi:hypothetical protein
MVWFDRWRNSPGVGPAGGLLSAALLTLVATAPASISAAPGAAGGAPVAAPTPDLAPMGKQVLLRTLNGAPAPGIDVRLVPAMPAMGGPPAAASAQTARTDATGAATFGELGRWMWLVSFQGSFQGRPLQSVAAQGRPPFGRTRSGGGFPLQVEPQEEGDAPAQVGGAGMAQPVMFVLVPFGAGWAPTLDLGLVSAAPLPLTAPAPPAASAGAPPIAASPAPADGGDLRPPLYLIPGAAALLIGLHAARRRLARILAARRRGGAARHACAEGEGA